MTLRHYSLGILSIAIVIFAAFQLWNTSKDLIIRSDNKSDPPVTFILPAGDISGRPLVLGGHGFAGSRQNLYGFAFTVAKAGYPVVLWDFNGHGWNPERFPGELDSDEFLANAETALVIARNQGLPTDRSAIIGHSMGSGVALQYGVTHPETSATIAVSPVPRPVTADLPNNLLLLAGSNEASFVRNAEQIQELAGGEGGSHADGNARKLVVIPYVEHVSILFAPEAHDTVVEWLNLTYGDQPGAIEYTDLRLVWWLLGLVGCVLFSFSIAPLTAEHVVNEDHETPTLKTLTVILIAATSTTLLTWLLSLVGFNIRNTLGLLVGGYVLIWFASAGLICWILLRWKPSIPNWRGTLAGLIAFGILSIGVGLFTNFVWMNWVIIWKRIPSWLLGSVFCFPWFLFLGNILEGKSAIQRLLWWLAYSLIFVIAITLGVNLIPGIGFLLLILPLMPIVLALHALVAGVQRGAWSFAISGALWVSWAIVVIFPLQ